MRVGITAVPHLTNGKMKPRKVKWLCWYLSLAKPGSLVLLGISSPLCCVCLLGHSCPTLCNPMHCSPPDSAVHGIFQARILEWVAISSSRGSAQPRDHTQISCTAGGFFTFWAIGEPLSDIIVIHGFPDSKQNHWSHEIKRPLLLGRKVMTSLDSILKCRSEEHTSELQSP